MDDEFAETDRLILQWDQEIAEDQAQGIETKTPVFQNYSDALVAQFNPNHGYHGRFSSGGGAGHAARLRAKVRSMGARVQIKYHQARSLYHQAQADYLKPGGEHEEFLTAEHEFHSAHAQYHRDVSQIEHEGHLATPMDHDRAASEAQRRSDRAQSILDRMSNDRKNHLDLAARHTRMANDLRARYVS